jgi:ribosome-associated protein
MASHLRRDAATRLASPLMDDGRMRDVPIDDDMIRLGQFLKLADVVDTGGEIKSLVADGEVRVNGELELRRGRQLHRGDVVAVLGERIRVA